MFPVENLSSLYHLDTNQQDSQKFAQSDSPDYRLPSTASASRFNSTESAVLTSSYSQDEYQSPSRFFSFGSNEASPSKSGHCDRDYQGSSFGFGELSETPIINFLQQEKKDEESIPTHVNTDTIFDPLKEDFNLDLQDAQDVEEEKVEQPKKMIFTIIRLERKMEMETHTEIEIETENPNSSYQLKNAPVHLFTAIKSGVSYYCDSKKDYFPSITQELRKLKKPQLKKFEKLMYGYHGKGKTFACLGRYLKENCKAPETLELFKTVLIAFVRDRDDVEKWLEFSKMKDHTKENIRKNLTKLEKDFLKLFN